MRKAIFIFIAIILVAASIDYKYLSPASSYDVTGFTMEDN